MENTDACNSSRMIGFGFDFISFSFPGGQSGNEQSSLHVKLSTVLWMLIAVTDTELYHYGR